MRIGGIVRARGLLVPVEQVKEHFREMSVAGLCLKRWERAGELNAASVEQAKTVAEAFGFIESVGRDDDRFAMLAEELDIVENNATADDIEPARRFVEQHDGGIVDQGAGEIDPLFLAGAKRRAAAIEEAGQREHLGKVVDAHRCLSGGHLVEIREIGECFPRGKPLIEAGAGGDEAKSATDFERLSADGIAINERVAAAGGKKAQQHAERCRLASTVGAEQAVDLPLGDTETQILDRENGGWAYPELFGEFADINHGGSRRRERGRAG